MKIKNEIARYFDRLWPLHRSLTGDGVRQTHNILGELLPLRSFEVPTGTEVFDWTVPKEWVVREAYIQDPQGERIVDVKDHTLHLVQYSEPFHGRMDLDELNKHLYSIPELPEAIPYVTSYWSPNWGFCLTESQRAALEPGEYTVVIDTDLKEGSMTYSEVILPGQSDETVLISVNTCHPSLANNELSGPLVAAFLYRRLAEVSGRRLTFHFVFLPESIGSLVFLSRNRDRLEQNLVAGFVLTCLGHENSFTYKRSRQGHTVADRAAEYVLGQIDTQVGIRDFWPLGGDERQYCSPGFDFPVGSIMRTVYGEYREYHTSLDNREFISFQAMEDSVEACFELCRLLDKNQTFKNRKPFGEPKLDRHNLFPSLRTEPLVDTHVQATLWLLNLCDGHTDLLSIAERSGLDFWLLEKMAGLLVEKGLLDLH